MSKVIYGILLVVALIAVVLSVGSLIDLPNPVGVLGFAIAFAVVLTVGYILGKRSLYYYEEEPQQGTTEK